MLHILCERYYSLLSYLSYYFTLRLKSLVLNVHILVLNVHILVLNIHILVLNVHILVLNVNHDVFALKERLLTCIGLYITNLYQYS